LDSDIVIGHHRPSLIRSSIGDAGVHSVGFLPDVMVDAGADIKHELDTY